MDSSDHPTKKTFDLTKTRLDLFDPPRPAQMVEPGQGCLLQIFPATSCSQLMTLHNVRTVIGRDPTCSLTIQNTSMSRRHAVIDLVEGRYFLSDLNSTNGTFLNERPVCQPVALHGGEQIRLGGCILKFMSKVDQEAHYHAVVHELMTRDSLTNAFNRSYLVPLIEAELEACRHQRSTIAILLLDIDRFKRINDDYGHLVGDEILRVFCDRVRGQLRKTDRLARFGGEEFLIACSQTTLFEASRIAERVRLSVSSAPMATQAGDISVTCSLGVAASNGTDLPTCDHLVATADSLLYIAKEAGRNRVQVPQQKTETESLPQ